MIPDELSSAEQSILLALARQSIELAVSRKFLPTLKMVDYPERLQANGASFVTLSENGDLRGCIGALEAYQALVLDVCEHAVAAALEDYRFAPLRPDEVSRVHIEISRLTSPQGLIYHTPDELLAQLRPGLDGVILRDGMRRATFLPQVWEKIPEPTEFLSHLCQKMGVPAFTWQHKPLQVLIYQVQEFHE
jgi:AmmeMemoRadiSam system protein A